MTEAIRPTLLVRPQYQYLTMYYKIIYIISSLVLLDLVNGAVPDNRKLNFNKTSNLVESKEDSSIESENNDKSQPDRNEASTEKDIFEHATEYEKDDNKKIKTTESPDDTEVFAKAIDANLYKVTSAPVDPEYYNVIKEKDTKHEKISNSDNVQPLVVLSSTKNENVENSVQKETKIDSEDIESNEITTESDEPIDNNITNTGEEINPVHENVNYKTITEKHIKKRDKRRVKYKQHRCQSIYPPDVESGCCGVAVNPKTWRLKARQTRSVGAEDTTLYQYPWLAVMEYEDKERFCTGFLISSTYVITAAHCVENFGKLKSVRLGALNRKNKGPDCKDIDGKMICNDGGVSYAVYTVVIPEDYNKNVHMRYDIALVRLRTTANYTDFIRPICLPLSDVTRRCPKNLNFEFGGWGAAAQYYSREADEYVDIVIGERLKVDLPYVPNEDCRRFDWNLTREHICAGGEAGQGPCSGDSGGPLMHKNRVFEAVGVYIYGEVPCGYPIPGVYTKVFEYERWILRQINIIELDRSYLLEVLQEVFNSPSDLQ